MNKKEKSFGREFIYGIHTICEVIKAKRRKIIAIYTTKPAPKNLKSIEALILHTHIPISYVSRDTLTKMAQSTDHQGVVACVQPFPFRKSFFNIHKHQFLLMLDGIQDVRNIGAILRSAYCTGIGGIILPQKNNVSLTAAAWKASAGLAEYLEIYQPPSSLAGIQDLVRAGYPIYLATFQGNDARTVAYQTPLCLIIGGEGTGINPTLFSYGTHITLPQRRSDLSYNASVAAGILLFLIATHIQILKK